MENILLFITAALTAFAAQNAIFARALGVQKSTLFLKNPRAGILYGGLLTWTATLSAVLVSGVNALVMDSRYIPFIRAPLYLLSICLVYALTYQLTKKKAPRLHLQIRSALPVSTFNSALFGAMFVSASQGYTFSQTVGYALGAGVGYTVALLVIYYARKRLAISPVPRSFRGLPILLLYIGLLSLAIYGLIGHGLPV